MFNYICLGLIFLICIVAPIIEIHIEAHYFNKGKCKHCGHDLSFFDYDSHGYRSYICDQCGYSTWVSYNTVDKDWRQHH